MQKSTSNERTPRALQRLMSAPEVADRLGIGVSTVWQWLREGRLPAPLRLSRRCTRWDGEAIEQWVAEQAEVAA